MIIVIMNDNGDPCAYLEEGSKVPSDSALKAAIRDGADPAELAEQTAETLQREIQVMISRLGRESLHNKSEGWK